MDNLFLDLTTSLLNIIRPVFSAFAPLLAGLIIAFLLNPAVSWFETRIKNRSLSILVTYLLVAAALAGLLYAFVILIAGTLPRGGIDATIQLIGDYFSDAMNAVSEFISGYLPSFSSDFPQNTWQKMQQWVSERLSADSFIDIMSSVAGTLISIFIGAVAAVYLLKDKEYFISLWEKFMVLVFRQKTLGIIREIMEEINQVITTFIKGALVDSIIVAFLSSLALTIAGTDFAVITGILAGLLNIIPYFGPFISMVPAFLTALFSGGPVPAVSSVIALFVVQQLDSNYIYPKIVGTTTGVHPFFVLLSVSVMGYFAGVAGMLLAVPAAGILQVLISRWAYSKK